MTKQEFAKVVQAWANGENIQCCGPNRKWEDLDDYDYPEWEAVTEYEASYRIKPKDITTMRFACMEPNVFTISETQNSSDNLKLIFTNNVLTTAEVLR
jgi:hypothetical protein